MSFDYVKTREQALDVLEGYAEERKKDLDQRRTRRPLVKSYLLETGPHNQAEASLDVIFARAGHELKRIDETLYRIFDHNKGKTVGLLEELIQRHPAIYTVEDTKEMDPWVKRLVNFTPALDHLWLSGRAFEELLQTVIRITPGHRFGRLVFQYQGFFEPEETHPSASYSPTTENGFEAEDDEAEDEDEIAFTDQNFDDKWDDDYVPERRSTKFSLIDRLNVIKQKLPEMRALYNPLHSISMLRFPARGRGGHDFYYNGKVTNRSDSFSDHRQHLQFVLKIYKHATEVMEQVAWQGIERTDMTTQGEINTLIGAPVRLEFSEPLSESVFNTFIESTFRRKHSKFRLWGNPIILGPRKVHVYGIDRHLWQQIFLEITDRHIVAIIPQGTCGNSVHRLVTNVQRYLDPGVKVWVGDTKYSELIKVRPDIRSVYDES
jgi:hypothetical protein